MKNKNEILKIADILLSVGRKDNRGKKIDTAYNDFEADIIFKYGCDRLNCATAIVEQGYEKKIVGKWITDEEGYVKCSNCGEEHTWDDFRPPYCDMCGAKMREEFESLGKDFL